MLCRRRTDSSLVAGQFDLVARVARYALAGNHWSETEEEDDTEPGAEADGERSRNETIPHGASTAPDRAKDVAARILQSLRDDDDDFPMIDSPDSLPDHTQDQPPFHDAQHGATNSPPAPSERPRQSEISVSPPAQREMPRQSGIHAVLHHGPLTQTRNTFPPPMPPQRPEQGQGQGQGLRLTVDSRFEMENWISPTLARFAFTPRNPDPETILPVLQQSPPSTSPTESPRRRQTLPSLRTYLQSTSPASFGSLSPIFNRPSPGQGPYFGLSPASCQPVYPGMSPPVPPYSSWRNTTQDSITSTPSEYTPANSATVSTPASSILAQSPVAVTNPPLSMPSNPPPLAPSKPPPLAPKQPTYTSKLPVLAPSSPPILSPPKPRMLARSKIPTSAPSKTRTSASSNSPTSVPANTPSSAPSETPTPAPSSPPTLSPVLEHKAEIAEDDTDVEVEKSPEHESELSLIEISPPIRLGPGPYQCSFEGCTAPPFQTQYLLNSHMNVHSNSRSHFCPVKDCPRAVGGLGFKRKNEMLR